MKTETAYQAKGYDGEENDGGQEKNYGETYAGMRLCPSCDAAKSALASSAVQTVSEESGGDRMILDVLAIRVESDPLAYVQTLASKPLATYPER